MIWISTQNAVGKPNSNIAEFDGNDAVGSLVEANYKLFIGKSKKELTAANHLHALLIIFIGLADRTRVEIHILTTQNTTSDGC
jgi:hypothetical protein